MSHRRLSKRILVSIAAFIGSGTLMSLAFAASKPLPPASICVGTKCSNAPANPPASGDIKWHPGHYVWVSGPGFPAKVQTATYSILDSTANDSSLAGIQIIFKWADLEGAKGDYRQGFATVDSILAKLNSLAKPKRLMISIQERSFGKASGVAPNGLLPDYIEQIPNGVAVAPEGVRWSGALQAMVRLDNPVIMDRLIALSQAYGERYNSHPLVEMYAPMGELAVSASAGISSPAYVVQVKRLYAATAKAWPNTLMRWQFNYAPSDSDDSTMLSLLQLAKTLPTSAVGGPDPESPLPLASNYPAGVRTIQGNKLFRGLKTSGGTATKAYEDLRGQLPWVGEYQGGPHFGAGDITPEEFADYEINVMHASHLVYIYNSWLPANTSSADPHKWPAQLAYIRSTRGATYPGVAAPGR